MTPKDKKKSTRRRKRLKSKSPRKIFRKSKTINLDADEMELRDDIITSLISEEEETSKRSKSSQGRITKKHHQDNLEMKKKLEDAEYKDLKQRYNEDERDKNYILNEQEAIIEAVDKESEAGNELNESIEKLEEEQDLEFKDRVALISHEFMKDIKFLDEEKDANELNNLHKAMIQKVFDCFLDNKQELLKKIAGKLASQRDIEEYLSSDGGRGDDDTTPRYIQTRKSDASYISKKVQKRKGTEDTLLQESKSAMSSKDNDYMENMMDDSDTDSDGERNDFYDTSPQKNLERKIRKRKSKRKTRDLSKANESVRTNLMNIQTTADLISYVKRRQNKKIMSQKRGSKVSKKTLAGIPSSRLSRREGVNFGGTRHFGAFKQGGRSVEIQTDDLDILDLR